MCSFLDIEMPKVGGLEILKTVSEDVAVVLISSHREFGPEAYEYEAVDYLIKPVKYSRFFQAVQKVQEVLQERRQINSKTVEDDAPNEMFVKSGYSLVRLDLNEVTHVEAAADYVAFHANGKKQLVYSTMKSIQEKLPENFIRIHRSFIVNIKHIDAVEDNSVVINKAHLPISSTYREELMGKLDFL